MRRAPIDSRVRDQEMIDHEGQHGLGQQGDADKDQDQRRLGQNGDHHGAARTDAAIGAAAVESGEHDHERSEREDEPAAENVAHIGKRQREIGEDGNEDRHRHHRREGDERRQPIDPGGGLRDDDLLVEQLPEIAIGLKDPRSLRELDAFLELHDRALQERGQGEDGEHLANLQDNVAGHNDDPRRHRLSAHAHLRRHVASGRAILEGGVLNKNSSRP